MRAFSKVCVAVWLLVLLASVVSISRTPLVTDMSAFLPAEPDIAQQLLIENLREGPGARVLLIVGTGIGEQLQAKFSNQFAAALRQSDHFEWVNNGALAGIKHDQQRLHKYRYQLSDTVDAARFSPPALRAAVLNTLGALSSSAGLFAKSQLLSDPTGEIYTVFDTLTPSFTPLKHNGVWVTRNGKNIVLMAHTVASGNDLDRQQAALAELTQTFDRLRQSLAVPAASLSLSGPAKFAVQSRDLIRGDVIRLSALGAGLIVLILFTALRSLRHVLLVLIPLLSAVLIGAASVIFVFGSVHGLTLGFGAALIGEAVDYALYQLLARNASIWRPITLGLVTSLLGFGALYTSGFPGLAQLAVFAMSGLSTAYAVTRWVLPTLTNQQKPSTLPQGLESTIDTVFLALRQWRPWVIVLAIVSLGICVVNRDRLWQHDLSALNPISQATQQADQVLREAIGTPSSSVLLMLRNTDGEQALLETISAVDDVLASLEQRGLLAGFETPGRLLPAASIQQRRLDALPESDDLRERLRAATQGLPIQTKHLAQFIADVAQAKQHGPVRVQDFDGTQIGARLKASIRDTPVASTAQLTLYPAEGKTLTQIKLGLEQAQMPLRHASFALLDIKQSSDDLYAHYLREAKDLALYGALAIALMLVIAYRSLAVLQDVILPVATAILSIVAMASLIGLPLGLLHLIALLLVAAIGSNYALVLSARRQRQPQDRQTSPLATLCLANLTTLTGFGVLAFSEIPLLASLGATVGIGAPLVLLLAAASVGSEPVLTHDPE